MSDAPQPDWRLLLTPSERARMLDDIARVSLVVGLVPQQPPQDGVTQHRDARPLSPLERLAWLEDALPRLGQAVRRISLSPLTRMIPSTRPVAPPARARRVATTALLRAALRPLPLRLLEESVTEETRDTAENRAVVSFVRHLAREARAIAQLADAEGAEGTVRRAEEYASRLCALLCDEWWEEVTENRAAWTRPPTTRATARPDYAVVSREMARARLALRFDEAGSLLLPPREAWQIYETWCLFSVLDALRELGYVPTGGREATTPDLFPIREGRLLWTLTQGEQARITLRGLTGRTVSVAYNQTYAQGERSLSHAMQPDITMEQDGRLWILDAKFKPYAAPGEEGEDINQMHAYRDAVVDKSGSKAVARAWCLYVGLAGTPNRPRLIYGRSEDAIVGALCLRPGDESGFRNLCDLLAGWLPAGQPGSP